ncbi:leucine-rich repeat-containing protein 56 [Anthonomus grandis grandis]|uniref:leucine-rich repeat-containing protein 56 n=1 Tax=Anthonomus grandis grandis TaxID=2921223 RepID=UPI002166445F|nr:leucine-rich repeat-containing protein 56 [Anthonomus grandis grandis]
MSPYLEEQIPEIPDLEPSESIYLTLTPLSDLSSSTTEDHQSLDSVSNEEIPLMDDFNVEISTIDSWRSYVPLEHNIRELLVRMSNTENLETVTQIKLRVIARELALQQLGFHLPALRELVLDGSIVSSLRDLGYGLRNLKILKVNRCQLICIDGVLGLESLEELYATDNAIKDLSPCAFLTNLKVLDVRRNSIKHLGSLSFLNFCPLLVHILLDGNEAIDNAHLNYQATLARLLPHLKIVDGQVINRDESVVTGYSEETVEDDIEAVEQPQVFEPVRLSRTSEDLSGFVVRFPPRVYINNDNSRRPESY